MAPSRLPPHLEVPVPFVLLVLVVAVAVSYARGGRLRHVADVSLRWSWLLFVGLGLQIGVDLAAGRGWLADAGTGGYLLLLASQVLVLVWVVANWRLPGMFLVALGLALNALVIGANGAMPVDPAAIRALGVENGEVAPGKHTLMTDETRLRLLADIWPLPPLRSIISIGDVVLAAGLVPVTHALMSPRSTRGRRVAPAGRDADTGGDGERDDEQS